MEQTFARPYLFMQEADKVIFNNELFSAVFGCPVKFSYCGQTNTNTQNATDFQNCVVAIFQSHAETLNEAKSSRPMAEAELQAKAEAEARY